MKFVSNHLNKLRECGHEQQSWVGVKLKAYAEGVAGGLPNCDASLLSSGAVDRDYLFGLIDDAVVPTATSCVAVMGWGGMRRDHARKVLNTARKWLPIAEDLRFKNISRTEAYSRFMEVRQAREMPGMGPAFFTKLIYFFGKNSGSRGYIMDQWTARSANLLLGKKLVHLVNTKAGSWVTDKNSEFVYEEFCQFIEKLALEIGVETDVVEEMIFSIGNRGRNQSRGDWRNYVLKYG